MKPNFFIIGAPKCGTTALSDYLRNHPNIFMCIPKEPNYFNFDFPIRRTQDIESYLNLFDQADPAIHQAVGEASPTYLNSKCAVKEILKFNPSAKFIVMLRNPVDFVQSFHSEMLFIGTENILNFEEAWRAQGDRREGKRIPASNDRPSTLLYSDLGKFSEKLERLFSEVDRHLVKTIIFDDFISDTKKIYEEVLGFLNVSSDERTYFPRVNENKKVRIPLLQPIIKRVSFFWWEKKLKWKITFGTGILYKIQKLNSQHGKRESISETLRLEMQECFRQDVANLSRLLDRDLSHWVSNDPAGNDQGNGR